MVERSLKDQVESNLTLLGLLMHKHRGSIPWGVFCDKIALPAKISGSYSNFSVRHYFNEQLGEPHNDENGKETWDLQECSVALFIINGIARITVVSKQTVDTTPPPSQLAFF